MYTIYEVFEFKQGKSLRNTVGPITHIRVEEGEERFDVLDALGLPGNTYGYGLKELGYVPTEQARLRVKMEEAAELSAHLDSLVGS